MGCFHCKSCGDKVETLCMVQSAKTGCSKNCNRLFFMKGDSVPGSGKQGQPKSTLNIYFFFGFGVFSHMLKENMGGFFLHVITT